MLTGRPHFYGQWQERLAWVVEDGPVVDIGTPSPFFKELSWLAPRSAKPYFCSDIRHTRTVDFVGDARAIPLRDGTVRAAVCQNVCNYVAEPRQIVDEIHRVLAPGGRAYVSLTSVAPYTNGYEGFPGDVCRFAPGSAEVLFDGWSSFEVLRGGGIGWVAWSYLPPRARHRFVIPVVDRLDRAVRTNISPVFYVFAVK